MAKDLYGSNLRELIKTIDSCFKHKENFSGLILLYSTLDIIVWLSRDQHAADATRKDFILWVEEYLLPGSKLPCSAEELYSARCFLIHSYAPEWGMGMNREGEAKKIVYTGGFIDKETVDGHTSASSDKDQSIILNIDDLVSSLKTAIQRFNYCLSDNQPLSELIDERSKRFFINVFQEEAE
jgi:hypothetical protein